MKKLTLITLLIVMSMSAFAQFSTYFQPKTMRMDYYHCGTATTEEFFIDELIEEPYWGGSQTNMIDTKEYGNQILKVYDKATGKLIYSQGFCTLFDEWQTTTEAQTIKKCYPESVVMPFPKAAVRVEILSRDRKNQWVKSFEYTVDPQSYWVRKSSPDDESFDVIYHGDPKNKVDIVMLAEGYSESEKDKFIKDCEVFATHFFSFEPYKKRKGDFNIRGVWRASKSSGASMPGEHMWKETAMDSHYYTFDSERYIMVDDFQKVRNLASNVPYDLIYILSNTKKYGGGGIYNFYGISAAGDPTFAGKVYVHEFGHLLVGLGDEYVGTTGYDEFYAKDVEPWEENLTTLVDFDKKAWKAMLPAGTKIPTADDVKNERVLGVYEGGGYQNKGIYRPWRTCLMRSWDIEDFCPVCTLTINTKLDTYVK